MSHKGCFQAQGAPSPPISRIPPPPANSRMAHSLAMATSLPQRPLSQALDPEDSALQAESGDGAFTSLLLSRVFMGGSAGSVSHPAWWRGIHSAFWVRTTYPHLFLCRALFGVTRWPKMVLLPRAVGILMLRPWRCGRRLLSQGHPVCL